MPLIMKAGTDIVNSSDPWRASMTLAIEKEKIRRQCTHGAAPADFQLSAAGTIRTRTKQQILNRWHIHFHLGRHQSHKEKITCCIWHMGLLRNCM